MQLLVKLIEFYMCRLMFWTDHGTVPSVKRANMDGTTVTTIVSQNIIWPNGLAIDYTGISSYRSWLIFLHECPNLTKYVATIKQGTNFASLFKCYMLLSKLSHL